jgi:benzoyl-CoA reductase subunit C
VNDRHRYAREWKERTGRGVVGYLCTYVPEEVLYAAGMLPVRILGSHEPADITEPHVFGMYCPHSRDCLAQGLRGKYDYLDGLINAHSCIHIRQTFASWQRHAPVPFSHYLFMPPHTQGPHALDCLIGGLADLKRALEEWHGQPIAQESLMNAVEVYNTNRRLMRQIYELRKTDPPPLSGAEAMEMVLAGMCMDKQEHNVLLQEALQELPDRLGRAAEIRLMTLGSENDDVEFIQLLESFGANIVIDDLCTGSRYFWNEVIPDGDYLSAIAARYINRPPCPVKDLVERRRLPHILDLAKEWGVQGVVIGHQKFCDPHQYDLPAIESMLKKNGIPILFLEYDVTIPAGQVRTRIEAFIETLQLELI